ncbi:hypothetical protein EG329_009229 [Mollisiaceae sp. DMI_Dod_QoI]|nr:hypothetical protein EG329_009229 [Helotiales sp. DMI_Dod_QoI]
MSEATLPKGVELEDVILALVPAELRAKTVDVSNSMMVNLKDLTKLVFIRAKRFGSWDNEQTTDAQRDAIKQLIWMYYKVEITGAEFKGAPVYAEFVLRNMANPAYNLPTELQQVANALISVFESNNWGIEVIEEEPQTPLSNSKKRRSNQMEHNNGAAPASLGVYVKAPNNHPIFGLQGIMNHIQASKGGQTIAYRIDPEYSPRDFRTFGHNGLTVGDVWPLQIAALRDGAHGSRIGGISGTSTVGVYSIIVSGIYSDLDFDSGNDISYSVAGAVTTTAAVADRENKGTKALLRSAETRNSIRVIRSSSSKWEGAPKAGLRYDGLYRITGYEERTNNVGGKFLRFKLRRQDGQSAIDRSKPSDVQAANFETVKLGY